MKLKNPFKRNKQLKQLRALSASFSILDEFERRGILHWQAKQKCLLIEETLATLKLAEGEKGFKHFLEQVAQWQNYRLLQDAYERHRIDIETKAVREAKKQYANLTKADIQRIRQNARANMTEIDPATVLGGNPSEFDLFIIRATAVSAEEALKDSSPSGRSGGALLALGHYDGKTLEMAVYEDIKHNLQKD